MLAIDQRESMRAMFAEKQATPVTDDQITEFKLAALRALTPIASAVLIDRPFAWRRAIAEGAISPGCGLIAAMDHFIEGRGELITDVIIDEELNPIEIRAGGGVALKLLIIWRHDEPAERRVALADDFISRCRDAGLISIIEPVSRKPHDGRTWDLADGILAAAKELGNRGADLYKAEVPRYGKGGEAAVRAGCAALTRVIQSPWVVLSSGVAPDDFPVAVEWACREGASGFWPGGPSGGAWLAQPIPGEHWSPTPSLASSTCVMSWIGSYRVSDSRPAAQRQVLVPVHSALRARRDAAGIQPAVQQSDVVRMLFTMLYIPGQPEVIAVHLLSLLTATLLKQGRAQCMAWRLHPGSGLSVGKVFADV
jgi:sulfofructosephosphate aldolase